MEEVNTIQNQNELIVAIFNLSKLERITTNSGKINTAFYKLKQEFPEYFEGLMFDTNGYIPFSNDLNDILSIFKLSGFIEWDGFRYYKLHKDKKYLEELKENFSEDITEIKEIANKFDEYISS